MAYTIVNERGNYLRWLKEGIWNCEGKISKNKEMRIYTFSERGCKGEEYSNTIKKGLAHLEELGYKNCKVVKIDLKQVVSIPKVEQKSEEIEEQNTDEVTADDYDENELIDQGINEKCQSCTKVEVCGQSCKVELIKCPEYKKAS